MAAPAVDKGAEERKVPVQVAVVFLFEHAACAVVRKEISERGGVVGKVELDGEAGNIVCWLMTARTLVECWRMKEQTEKKKAGNGSDGY